MKFVVPLPFIIALVLDLLMFTPCLVAVRFPVFTAFARDGVVLLRSGDGHAFAASAAT